MKQDFIKIQAFEISTPKFLGKSYDPDRYDHEQIEYLIKKILKEPLKKRAFHKNNKVINLLTCKDSDDQDFMEGTFSTARYGQEEEIIDVHEQNVAGNKPKNHGVKHELHFLLDKNTGLLLIQKDKNNVISRDMLHRYFNYHLALAEKYREAFNKINPNLKIIKRSYVKVTTVPSQEFFEEIEKFALIKEAFVIKDVDTDNITNEGLQYLRNQAIDNGVENFQTMKVSYMNNVKRSGIKHVKQFLKKLYEEEKYDNYGVTGTLESGKNRTLTMARIPQGYDVKVTFNEMGLPNFQEIISHMVNIAKFNNPIANKNNGAEPIQKVGALDNEQTNQTEEIDTRREQIS
ncbi:hypothetical protein [Neobacillus sp.]|uniref:hypothetical protein n=1 Tax=Neobacillus sp. TaxID=2675273 RepID=UPI0035B5687E